MFIWGSIIIDMLIQAWKFSNRNHLGIWSWVYFVWAIHFNQHFAIGFPLEFSSCSLDLYWGWITMRAESDIMFGKLTGNTDHHLSMHNLTDHKANVLKYLNRLNSKCKTQKQNPWKPFEYWF